MRSMASTSQNVTIKAYFVVYSTIMGIKTNEKVSKLDMLFIKV